MLLLLHEFWILVNKSIVVIQLHEINIAILDILWLLRVPFNSYLILNSEWLSIEGQLYGIQHFFIYKCKEVRGQICFHKTCGSDSVSKCKLFWLIKRFVQEENILIAINKLQSWDNDGGISFQ